MTNSGQLAFDSSGTLSRVWLSAHWDKKLSKSAISCHDISESVGIIKAPGNVYSLRISGYLLLGLTKIYSKKSIIALEEIEQTLHSLTQTTAHTTPEVLKEIGLTEIPEKIKLTPMKKPELFTPIAKAAKSNNKESTAQKDLQIAGEKEKEVDVLGINTSFLDDVEMAEQWLRKDDEELIELPVKRGREKVWQNFINPNIPVQEERKVENPAEELKVKEEEVVEEVIEPVIEEAKAIEECKDIEKDINLESTQNDLMSNEPIETEVVQEIKERKKKAEESAKPPKKRRQKTIVRSEVAEIIINPDDYIGLDCTTDIVKNTRLFQKPTEIIPQDLEQIFYMSIIKEIAPELENFFLSHVKLQRLKNLFREEEEDKEPVILSNIAPERPENPIIAEAVEEIKAAVVEDVPKEEKEEDRNEETWSSRTLKLLKLLKVRLTNHRSLLFEELSKKMDRRIMSCGFYEVLQLSLKDFIVISEENSKIVLKGTERLLRLSIM